MHRLSFSLFCGLFFIACSKNSIYVGGSGAYTDFVDVASWKNNSHSQDKFEVLGTNTPLSKEIISKISKSSLLDGLRDSPAIQRATMRPYVINGKWYYPTRVELGEVNEGIASWYGPNFHSKKTSNGEIYNMHAHTAASKTLPMNTIVLVKNLENNKSTIVRINDRGPFVDGRIIDLSNIAARDIDMIQKGTANVMLEIIGFGGKISPRYIDYLENNTAKDEFKVDSKNVQESIDGGIFMLQIGSFSIEDNAISLTKSYAKALKSSGYKMTTSHDEENNLYRVFVSGFKSQEEALDFAKTNNIKSKIVIRQ